MARWGGAQGAPKRSAPPLSVMLPMKRKSVEWPRPGRVSGGWRRTRTRSCRSRSPTKRPNYLMLFLIQGLDIIALLSDHFGWGWDLFGTAGYEIDDTIIARPPSGTRRSL